MLVANDTIAAIATARGEAGVAVIRISGPNAWAIAQTLFSKKRSFQPGRFYHGWIVDPMAGESGSDSIVDEVLLLVFQGPNSYTGEDVVEIHCHGGDLITHKILDLCLQTGSRIAQPGEYTLRAFLNGKMDLTQAESVMDLVSAKSDRLLQQASANLKNRSLGQYIDRIGRTLIEIQGQIVASVDFPDEVDEPERAPLIARLKALQETVSQLRDSAQRNRLIREGLKVAILGKPNSGKSSLFNHLLAAERAIVTEIAGTTRDVITESLTMNGIPVTLIDTAGIREAEQIVEQMGIERSWHAAREAHAVLYVFDASVGLDGEDQTILAKLDPDITRVVANKLDLVPNVALEPGWIGISTKTGQGVSRIYQELEQFVQRLSHEAEGAAVSLNQRQAACCEAIEVQLESAISALSNPAIPLDVTTVPLTEALRKLDELMGRDTAEEVLTEVFQQFCVGK